MEPMDIVGKSKEDASLPKGRFMIDRFICVFCMINLVFADFMFRSFFFLLCYCFNM